MQLIRPADGDISLLCDITVAADQEVAFAAAFCQIVHLIAGGVFMRQPAPVFWICDCVDEEDVQIHKITTLIKKLYISL